MEKNKEENFISAVVYVHNEEKNITEFLTKINNELSQNFKKYEIICVDDASDDGSKQAIKEFADSMKNNILTIVSMSFYQGIELSMNAGIDISIGDYIYEFDNIKVDYPLDLIMDVYKEALKGNDIVSCSSTNKMRKSSALFYRIFNRYSKNKYKIKTETFRIISRRGINRVNAINKTIPYRKATYASCGLRYSNIEYKPTIEVEGRKINRELHEKRNDIALDTLMIFTNVGYKFSMIMSLVMLLCITFVAIYTICVFVSGSPIAGWTTIMLFLSVVFFGVFSLMTIMIKYLSIIVDLIFRKNKYMIEGIEKLTK